MSVTHRVYWTQDGHNMSKDFQSDELDGALKQCESLRKRRIEGEDISFITIASEIPDCVSLSGVAATGPDYDWKKRRN